MQRICEHVAHLNEDREVQTHYRNIEEEVNNLLYSNSTIFVTHVGQAKTLYFVSSKKDSKAWILIQNPRY